MNLYERVDPFDASEAVEITIIAGDGGAMLERMQGNQGICGENTARTCFFQ